MRSYVEQHSGRHYPFVPLPLPYAYNALEPNIDTLTMQLHHDRHYTGYVNNLNEALKGCPQYHEWSLEQLICYGNRLPAAVRTAVARNAGGVFNHEFYFAEMSPAGSRNVHTFEAYKDELKKAALAVFGSGYAWLCMDVSGGKPSYTVIGTANQDTPLTLGLAPVLCIDVWEHAYYLKHYNKRDDYFDDWWGLVA
jgi:Fe-Mn family superoxide dismutase